MIHSKDEEVYRWTNSDRHICIIQTNTHNTKTDNFTHL